MTTNSETTAVLTAADIIEQEAEEELGYVLILSDHTKEEARQAVEDALLREPTRAEEHEYDSYSNFARSLGWDVKTFDEWLNTNTKEDEE